MNPPDALPAERGRQVTAAVVFTAALLAIAPTIISYTPYRVTWDEADFAHSALCLNKSFWSGDLRGMIDCFDILSKSPIIPLLSLPWGPIGGTPAGVGLVIFSLALLTWVFVVTAFLIMMRASVPVWLLVPASLCVVLNPAWYYPSALYVDQMLSWIILCTLLLVHLESRSKKSSMWKSVQRGLLWGFLASAGFLSKVTYVYFFGLMAPVVVLIKWRRDGFKRTGAALLAALLVSIPTIVVWLKCGRNFLKHARMASWGTGAENFFSDSVTLFAYCQSVFTIDGAAVYPMAAIVVFLVVATAQRKIRWLGLLPLAIILVYVVICSTSPNKSWRFMMPAMVALPFLMAALVEGEQHRLWAHIVPVLGLGLVLACVPIALRPEHDHIHDLKKLLQNLKGHNVAHVMISTDSLAVNFQKLRLAREFMGQEGDDMSIHTSVYDGSSSQHTQCTPDRIELMDAVLFEQPYPRAPVFSNVTAKSCYRTVADSMVPFQQDEVDNIEVFVSPRFFRGGSEKDSAAEPAPGTGATGPEAF